MMYSLLGLDTNTTLLNDIVAAVGSSPADPSPTPSPSAPTATPSPSSSGPAPTPSPSTPAGCSSAAWSASATYTGGNQVSHKGHLWKAKWWTQGEEPGTTGEWGVWQDLGAC